MYCHSPQADPFTLARAHSRHVARLADVGLTDRLTFNALAEQPFTRARMHEALGIDGPGESGAPACAYAALVPDGAPDLAVRLRRLRRQCLLTVIGRDLAGRADLAEVTATMTALAEVATGVACAQVVRELDAIYGAPLGNESQQVQPLLVVGMGKLGGAELNVSSDIDLVFVYPEEGDTAGARSISNHEYFVRFGRKVIALMNDLTADGFVFRVDMRLRPYGDSGPLACSLAMLEEYFVAQGREWERYAWIKGRIIARSPARPGDAAGITDRSDAEASAFDATVQPFVFRRHLDFSAIASMRELSEQIRREVARRDLHDNIKLGAGGIRQIEFIAQVFQLIRGGGDPLLRARPTLEVLAALATRSIVEPEVVAMLARSYDFLRRLEHRLQYLDDAQTHSLPEDEADRTRIAHSMGYADWTTFSVALDELRGAVRRVFDQVCAISPDAGEDHPLASLWCDELRADEAGPTLGALGYREPGRIAARLVELRASARFRRMAGTGQARLGRVIPRVVEVAARVADPDAAIERLLDIVVSIGRRESYLALLLEHPPVLERLGALAGASPWASGYLAQHPILLDELIDARTLHAAPAWPRLRADLDGRLDAAVGNLERQLDALRHFKHAQLFRVVVQDLAGDLMLEVVSDQLTELADIVLETVLQRCWRHLNPETPVDAPGAAPAFGIIGYGKLGGKEMGYGSDLDLAFVYDEGDAAGGAGLAARADNIAELYARLALRLNSWLSSMTSAGVLYATDLRLRPDGASGLLAPSMTAFEQYQRDKAWVWEHQALTRARFIAGPAALRARFDRLRDDILRQPREITRLRVEIADMRRKMRESRRTAKNDAQRSPVLSDTFDIKHGIGGLVDLEFIVQFLVLAHAHALPQLTGNVGNLALLQVAARYGLVDTALAAAAQSAYRGLRRSQHWLQLAGKDPGRAPALPLGAHTGAIAALWQHVLGSDQEPD